MHDSRKTLDWADVVHAMNLEGLNGNVSPLLPPSQDARPFPDQQRTAIRVLGLLRGSYLFDLEPAGSRIIQDPLSVRSYSQRNGAARKAWRDLNRDILIQINSSDENPVAAPGTSPNTPELRSEYAMRFYVNSNGKQGYVFSNANWAPITWTNEIEAFSIALASAAAATVQRIERLGDTFFTVAAPAEVLTPDELRRAAPRGSGYNTSDLMSEIQTLANPVPAQGNAIVRSVEDTEAFGRQKVARSRLIADNTLRLTGEELLASSFWMEVRERQRAERDFGASTSATLTAFRQIVPWQLEPTDRPPLPAHELAYGFLRDNAPSQFTAGVAEAARARRTSSKSRTRRAQSRRVLETSARGSAARR